VSGLADIDVVVKWRHSRAQGYFKEYKMAKKKSKGVLERIGDAASSAAEVVIDAGSKAVHAVGEMMPAGSSPKGAKASKKTTPRASGKTSKTTLATASKPKAEAKTKTVAPRAAKPSKKSTAAKTKPKAKASSKPPAGKRK
jgi:hypothetical protein